MVHNPFYKSPNRICIESFCFFSKKVFIDKNIALKNNNNLHSNIIFIQIIFTDRGGILISAFIELSRRKKMELGEIWSSTSTL